MSTASGLKTASLIGKETQGEDCKVTPTAQPNSLFTVDGVDDTRLVQMCLVAKDITKPFLF